MTVKELIEMLKTCDEESIVYIDYNGDINSINEVSKEFEKAYYKLEDPAGDVLKENDIKRFISNIESIQVGSKTTNTTLTCLTGFEVHGQSSCIKPENFNLGIGAAYAQIKAEDKIWEGLGFVLQWAKYGLKK